jgi:hypothetical protein
MRLDNPGGNGTFQLFRWNNSTYETVHTFPIGTAEETIEFDVANHNRYIDGDGRIQAQLKTSVVATFSASGFRQSVDLLEYAGTP